MAGLVIIIDQLTPMAGVREVDPLHRVAQVVLDRIIGCALHNTHKSIVRATYPSPLKGVKLFAPPPPPAHFHMIVMRGTSLNTEPLHCLTQVEPTPG
jgi:hypothetical protein